MAVRLLALAAATCAAAGCERARDRTAADVVEKLVESGGREAAVEVDRRSGSITVELGSAVVPDDWPPEVPVYPQASRLRARREDDGRLRLSVTSDDSPESLARFYRRELASRGWSVEPDGDELRARRAERRLTARFSKRRSGWGGNAEIEIVAGA
jgi:hypothetical protein